jgi:hypothetical protein
VTDFPVCIELMIRFAAPGGMGAGEVKPLPTKREKKFAANGTFEHTKGGRQLSMELPVS